MKRVIVFAFLIFAWAFVFGQNGKLEVKTVYLNNGMKVLLCEDHSRSEIYGGVCVHAGSKNDPADATGMAHYLEHMMFKGTTKIGTLDWESEKPLINQISKLYDEMSAASSDKEKKAILKNINKLSAEAAQYAIPNEVDAILGQIGGTGVNAFTSNDITVYHNIFPSGELEKWSVIYAERFREPVFRLFQSELEAVYEEYNMYSDDPFSVFSEDVMAAAFPNHPYGISVIGYPEHIKNPSMSKMHEFFRTYYVPINMTLVLVGDFNTKDAINILNNTWCANATNNPKGGNAYFTPDNDKKKDLSNPDNYKKKGEKKFAKKALPPVQKFQGRQVITTAQTPIKTGCILYQTVPSGNKDATLLDLCTSILSNSFSTGLFDQLCNEHQLYAASCYNNSLCEAGLLEINYFPKTDGQTHEQAEELIDQCINKLKKGDFSDQLFEAVKMNYLKEQQLGLESLSMKFYNVLFLEIDNKTVADFERDLEMVKQLKKSDLVAIANKYFGENVMIYRSDVGSKKTKNIEKPTWKPIPAQNTDKHSEFALSLDRYNSIPSKIQKIDFEKDVTIVPITNAYKMYAAKNPCNDIFSLNLVFDYGTVNEPNLEYAIEYFNLQGTDKKTFDEFSLELQALGGSFDLYTSDNTLTVSITGFDKDFAKIMALCSEKLSNPGNDEKKIDILVENHINSLKTMKEDCSQMGKAVYDYAAYGNHSPYLMMPTTMQVKKFKGQDLLSLIQKAMAKPGHATFAGNVERSTVVKNINQYFSLINASKKHPDVKFQAIDADDADNTNKNLKVRPVENYNAPAVYVLHSPKFIQSNIYFYIPGKTIDEGNKVKSLLFNEYYDGGMNSVIFQNIRELRSLGYSAYGEFEYDHLNRRNSYTTAFLGTQSDKTIDGIKAMSELLKTFYLQPEKFEVAKQSLVKQYEASHISFRRIPEQVYQWELEGYDSDPRAMYTSMLMKFQPNDIQNFFNANIGNRPLVITIAGNMNRINKKQLSKFGKVTFLDFNDVLNN